MSKFLTVEEKQKELVQAAAQRNKEAVAKALGIKLQEEEKSNPFVQHSRTSQR